MTVTIDSRGLRKFAIVGPSVKFDVTRVLWRGYACCLVGDLERGGFK
jgi:hypothetical protein